jgi:hypothetical protein
MGSSVVNGTSNSIQISQSPRQKHQQRRINQGGGKYPLRSSGLTWEQVGAYFRKTGW